MISLKISKKFSDVKKVRSALGSKKTKLLLSYLKHTSKELELHFKKDKWDLDYNFIYHDAINKIIGADLFLFVFTNLNLPNVNLTIKNNKFVLEKQNKRKKK